MTVVTLLFVTLLPQLFQRCPKTFTVVLKVILQNPKTGHQYVFELKDRLIRDEEFDGWKEIPLKRDNIWVWSGADACLPGSVQFTAI